MENIYIIKYITGEYEDRTERVFLAFDSDFSAKGFCQDFNSALKESGCHYDQGYNPEINTFTFRGYTIPVDYTGSKVEWETVPYISH